MGNGNGVVYESEQASKLDLRLLNCSSYNRMVGKDVLKKPPNPHEPKVSKLPVLNLKKNYKACLIKTVKKKLTTYIVEVIQTL